MVVGSRVRSGAYAAAMEHGDHLEAAEREAAALVTALRDGPVDAPVPSCPDWTVADLALHVGGFAVWAHVLCEGTGRPKTPYPDPPEGPAIVDWADEVLGHLLTELRATPPDTEVWGYVRDGKTAAFIARRAANELAVHRYDAQLARGTQQPIATDLAEDGIEEIFHLRLGREDAAPHVGSGETLHLHSSEGHEWLIRMEPDDLVVTREHAKGDLALRGAVSDLELVLYGRPTVGELERFGDESVLDVWYREFTF